MKIGILTFHSAHNYGAVLQSMGLFSYLTKLGYEVEIIDYRPEWVRKIYSWNIFLLNDIRDVKTLLKLFLLLPFAIVRYYKFERLISNWYSPTLKDPINKQYDCIFIGSDQVWNINITNGFDYYYWGDFKIGERPCLVSYATSMSENELSIEEKNEIAKKISKFNCISVREKFAQEKLSNFTNKEITITVDPTLLHNYNFWNKLASKKIISKPYLLYYQARTNSDSLEYAKKIAKKKNLYFVNLSVLVNNPNNYRVLTANPSDFLSLIKYSDYVVTTSFHGTVFAIIFHKDFISIKLGDGKDGRTMDLLSSLGLLYRMISINDVIPNTIIDWNNIDLALEVKSNSSKQFIKKSIANEED